MFGGDMVMRDHLDNNGVWLETTKLLRSKDFDRDLQIPDPVFRVVNAQPNLSHFFQKLTPCTGEVVEELYDVVKQSK